MELNLCKSLLVDAQVRSQEGPSDMKRLKWVSGADSDMARRAADQGHFSTRTEHPEHTRLWNHLENHGKVIQ